VVVATLHWVRVGKPIQWSHFPGDITRDMRPVAEQDIRLEESTSSRERLTTSMLQLRLLVMRL